MKFFIKSITLIFATSLAFFNVSVADDRPNILWIVSEDNGARWFGCYGNPAKPTPTLDKLAAEGFRYERCYSSIPVCAPQRFTWLTGINAISAGTQGMRSGVQIPDFIRYYPEIFQDIGYYTSKGKDAKTDYNHRSNRSGNDSWNEPKKLEWDVLKQKQPFMHVINTHSTHESRVFGAYNPNKHTAPKAGNLAAYHPDLPSIHFVYEKYNEAHRKMDAEVKTWLTELEQSGLAESTIVIYSSDHGGVLPRSKRFLYNSGTHCPLIVRIPEKYKNLYPASKPGDTVKELVSFTDFPKTWLNLGGATKDQVEQMQGRSFLGKETEPNPEFVYSFRNRMDDRLDMVRSARDNEFLYIRNYMPFAPVGQFLPYLFNSQAMRDWKQHDLDGKTDAVTSRFFKQPRAIDELYLYKKDYDNVKNLAADSANTERIKAMRAALRKWQLEIFDSGFIPEDEMGQQAAKYELTVYEFVRKPELYPLEQYIDMADKSLELDPKNLGCFLESLNSPFVGNRYWATLGILNLSFAGDSTKDNTVLNAMQALLEKSTESQVVKAYAAWVIVRSGNDKQGQEALDFLKNLGHKTYSFRTVLNVLDWMDSKHSSPVMLDIYLNGKRSGDSARVITNHLVSQASAEVAELVEQHSKAVNSITNHEKRLKNYSQKPENISAEKIAKQTTQSQAELARATAVEKELRAKLEAKN